MPPGEVVLGDESTLLTNSGHPKLLLHLGSHGVLGREVSAIANILSESGQL